MTDGARHPWGTLIVPGRMSVPTFAIAVISPYAVLIVIGAPSTMSKRAASAVLRQTSGSSASWKNAGNHSSADAHDRESEPTNPVHSRVEISELLCQQAWRHPPAAVRESAAIEHPTENGLLA